MSDESGEYGGTAVEDCGGERADTIRNFARNTGVLFPFAGPPSLRVTSHSRGRPINY